ncbi:Uu.00g098570.m01.CDS01 [Anthostomella pinea]|uniref:Uu.00g098570.m01.CDS01 n=1 Tax=Anthostomella pinea TaxID=933095 RepID=A0AAI8V7K0_9PEZI|nr:Uu.00g098570.m01.CDS01 [Anthostomella pinea]
MVNVRQSVFFSASTAFYFTHCVGIQGPFQLGFLVFTAPTMLIIPTSIGEHGRTMWTMGPNKLVFNTVQALHDIYRNERFTKSHAYLVGSSEPGVYGIFNAIDKQLHQRKRNLVSRVLNERSMRSFEPIMQHQVNILVQQLRRSCDGSQPRPVNMTERLKYLAMDIMGQLAFSFPLKLQTETTHRSVVASKAHFYLNLGMQLPFLGTLSLVRLPFLRSQFRGGSYFKSLETMLRSRIAGRDNKQDLLYLTDRLSVSEDDEVLLREMESEAVFFLSAGSDTISTTLCAVFFYLSRNPECYRKLTHEIHSTFNSESDIRNGPQLTNCHYMRACIDEALRMSPPLPGTLWREEAFEYRNAAEPFMVDGHIVPRGTQIGVNAYAMHHNEEYFPDSFTYKPERWLPDSPEAARNNRNAFAAFSTGSRGCVGKAMAYLEASLVVAKTLWYFDFEQASDTAETVGGPTPWERENGERGTEEFELRDMFVADHDGPHLVFRPRQTNIGGDFGANRDEKTSSL